jgi:predicted nucleic acid-binding protein
LGELTKWTEVRHWGARSRQALADWLSNIPVLPGDEPVAATWGRLSAAGIQRGRPRPVNDMWIAACCLTYDLPLATLNLKDYEDFKEHNGLRILGAE